MCVCARACERERERERVRECVCACVQNALFLTAQARPILGTDCSCAPILSSFSGPCNMFKFTFIHTQTHKHSPACMHLRPRTADVSLFLNLNLVKTLTLIDHI